MRKSMCGYVIPNQSLELPTVDDKEEQENWKKTLVKLNCMLKDLKKKIKT
jgi:hypothetical protein